MRAAQTSICHLKALNRGRVLWCLRFLAEEEWGAVRQGSVPSPLQDGSHGQEATGPVPGALVPDLGQGHSSDLGSEAGGGSWEGAGGWKDLCWAQLAPGWTLNEPCHEVGQRESSCRKLSFHLKGCTCGFGAGQPQWVLAPLLLTEWPGKPSEPHLPHP